MAAFWILVLVGLLALVVGAYLSDRRDRRNGLDPAVRVQAMFDRKKARRQRRKDWFSGWFQPDEKGMKRPDPKPWER